MKLIKKNLLILLTLVMVSLLLRFSFWAAMPDELESKVPFSWLLTAFLHGIRFDLSALIYTNLLVFLLLPWNYFRRSRILAFVFAFLNSFYVVAHLFDLQYFLAYGKRLTSSFATAVGGTNAGLAVEMASQYWGSILITGACVIGFYHLFRCTFSNAKELNPKQTAFYYIVLLASSFLMIRGGLQKRVLSPQHAALYAHGNTSMAQLTLNTVHNLIRSKGAPAFPSGLTAVKSQTLDRPRLGANIYKSAAPGPTNVVFIFVESMSLYSTTQDGKNLGLLLGLSDEDMVQSDQFFGNGDLSMDAITAAFFGIPSYFNMHFFGSQFANNKVYGLGSALSEKGYQNLFIHGAVEGTQYFDVIARAAGIPDFHSVVDDYEVPDDQVALWGVHDEFFYTKSLEILDEQKKPFFATLFTTSSHVPFKGTPNNRKGTGEIEKDYFLSLEYAIAELKVFFEKLENYEWYEDTLFVVTGDHSPPISTSWNLNLKNRFRLPLLLFKKGSGLGKSRLREPGQLIDLPLTVMDFLGIEPEKWSAYGESLFLKGVESPVFNTDRGQIFIAQKGSKPERKSVDFTKAKDEVDAQIKKHFSDYVYRLRNDEIYSPMR